MSGFPHILVIRRRYLGDIVLLGSFWRNLRLHWPSANLRILVEPAYSGAVALNPDGVSALLAPTRTLQWPRFLRDLRRLKFTHVFNFDNTEGTAALTRMSGAPFRLGLHHGGFRLKFPSAYTHAVHHSTEEHESHPITEYYLKSLPAAGVPIVSREVRLEPRPKDVAELRRFVGAMGAAVLVHPGSRSPWRQWPADRFAAACDRLQEELGAQVLLVGGPADRARIAEIRRIARTHLLPVPEPWSIPRFAALARISEVVLCHDSGPMHVAAAVGTPVVALYGSQNSALFRPIGEGHRILQAPMPCTPCIAPDRCVPTDSYRTCCVRKITVEEAFAAVREQLARFSGSTPRQLRHPGV